MRERVDLKSPVREYRPPGSVRGALGNQRPYLDIAALAVYWVLRMLVKRQPLWHPPSALTQLA